MIKPLISPQAYALSGRGIQFITQIAMVLIFPKILAPSDYVQFNLLLPLVFLFVSLLFGWLIGATFRHIHPLLDAAGNKQRQTVFWYFGVTTSLLLALYLVVSTASDSLYVLIPLLIAANALKSGLLSILNAAEKQKPYFFANLCFALSLAVFIGINTLAKQAGLATGLVIYSFIDIILALAGWYMMGVFSFPPLPRFDSLIARQYFLYGLPIVINNLFVWVVSLSDRYLLMLWESTEHVANYILSYQLASSMITIPLMLAITVIFPKIIRIDKEQNQKAALDYTHRFRKSYLRLMPVLLVCGCLVVLPFKHYLYSDFELEPALIVIILLAQLINGLSHFYNKEFELNGKTLVITKSIGLGALVNTVLNLALIPHFGLLGSATATLVAYSSSVFIVFKAGKYRSSKI